MLEYDEEGGKKGDGRATVRGKPGKREISSLVNSRAGPVSGRVFTLGAAALMLASRRNTGESCCGIGFW